MNPPSEFQMSFRVQRQVQVNDRKSREKFLYKKLKDRLQVSMRSATMASMPYFVQITQRQK